MENFPYSINDLLWSFFSFYWWNPNKDLIQDKNGLLEHNWSIKSISNITMKNIWMYVLIKGIATYFQYGRVVLDTVTLFKINRGMKNEAWGLTTASFWSSRKTTKPAMRSLGEVLLGNSEYDRTSRDGPRQLLDNAKIMTAYT